MTPTSYDEPGWPVNGYAWRDLPDDPTALQAILLDRTDEKRAEAAAVKFGDVEKTRREAPRIEAALAYLPPAPTLTIVDEAPDPRTERGFEPMPTLAEALAAVETFLRRFVVFGRPEAVVAVVLWLAHSYAIGQADATPYLAVTSPEKGSGKTRLLECLRLLARGRPGIFVIPTAATIYRMLEADPETPLLLDELDAVFRDRSDKYEEVRALINAGHRRGATVPRTLTTGNKHGSS